MIVTGSIAWPGLGKWFSSVHRPVLLVTGVCDTLELFVKCYITFKSSSPSFSTVSAMPISTKFKITRQLNNCRLYLWRPFTRIVSRYARLTQRHAEYSDWRAQSAAHVNGMEVTRIILFSIQCRVWSFYRLTTITNESKNSTQPEVVLWWILFTSYF